MSTKVTLIFSLASLNPRRRPAGPAPTTTIYRISEIRCIARYLEWFCSVCSSHEEGLCMRGSGEANVEVLYESSDFSVVQSKVIQPARLLRRCVGLSASQVGGYTAAICVLAPHAVPLGQ